MLHKDYHQSIRGEDGEEPIDAISSPPRTDMDSYYYSGPSTDLANTASQSDYAHYTRVLIVVVPGETDVQSPTTLNHNCFRIH